MIKLLTKLCITTFAIMITTFLLPGIEIYGLGHHFSTITFTGIKFAFYLSILLSVLNVTVKPILKFFTLPFTILTLGLFLFVINALVIELAAYLMDSFSVSSFWTAMLFSIILTVLQWLLNKIFGTDDDKSVLLDQHGNIIK